MEDWLTETRTSYDTVAESYATLLHDLLADSPHERGALNTFAERTGRGPVGDIGCGPGRITAYLHDRGMRAFGIDLSPAMIRTARRTHPHLPFAVGSMTHLPLADASTAGLVAWYSLIHVPDRELDGVLTDLRRVLRTGGRLLVAFHAGTGSSLKTEGYGGHPMRVRVHRREPRELADRLHAAGFAVDARTTVTSPESRNGAILSARRTG
ncbi:methyltransferase [Pilimelia anulata]|uniref:Methyltransferase n=1 Tax=Pilimelia anulata TaxID=53371 RepID=A0A8J3B5C2_9ACTN|nr:class I SAM-dependent methyltransferase [Pilimelia anulata]GGJ88411.1 methyltransferase [Pilimelia anulata]